MMMAAAFIVNFAYGMEADHLKISLLAQLIAHRIRFTDLGVYRNLKPSCVNQAETAWNVDNAKA